jgi:uncharacterized RDD family membrane protein YckC
MDVVNLEAPRIEVRRDYATFWRRGAAALIDGVLVRLASGVLGAAMSGLLLPDIPLIEVAYSIGFIAFGATPAMHMLGIRVIDEEGKDPGWRRSAIRFILPALGMIPWYFVLLWPDWLLEAQVSMVIVFAICSIALAILDPLWMIWDGEKQTLHDKLASTWVIRV